MSKLIKKFRQPAGPIEFYSGMLPEVEIAAPIKHINDKTAGVYLVDTDLKRKDGRGRVYRGNRDGKDIYYLTSKDSDKIIGYTYDVPGNDGKWSWNGYQDYLDNWTKPESSKPEEGQHDRTHTERRKEMKRLNKKNPMYRGLTLNGNTDTSYAGTLKNNENQAALGQGLQAALNAAAAAMFMGGPAAADTMFDLTDGLNNAAAGNWGMAGLSLGSALLPGISYGTYRVNNALDNALLGISSQDIAEAVVDGMTSGRLVTQTPRILPVEFDWGAWEDAMPAVTLPVPSAVDMFDLNIPTSPSALTRENVLSMPLQRNALYRIGEWLRPEYANHNVRNFTTYIPSAEVAETLRYFGLEPGPDYMNNLAMLDDYLVRSRAGQVDAPSVHPTTPVTILGRNYNLSGLSDETILALTALDRLHVWDRNHLLNRIINDVNDLPDFLRLVGLPDLGNARSNKHLLATYLDPEFSLDDVFHYVNSGDPAITTAFAKLNPRYKPIDLELYEAIANALLGDTWDPIYNQPLYNALQQKLLLPEDFELLLTLRENVSRGVPLDLAHLSFDGLYDGSYDVAWFRGNRASTPELAKQYSLKAPEGNRAAALSYNEDAAQLGLPLKPVDLFTEEEILNMPKDLLYRNFVEAANAYEPSFVMRGLPYIEKSSDVTPEAITTFLTKNTPERSKGYVKLVERSVNDATATSGNVIEHHSLSTDSYPLKMRRIAQGVRNGSIVPLPYDPSIRLYGLDEIIDGIPYQPVNDFGILNRIKVSDTLAGNIRHKTETDPFGNEVVHSNLENATTSVETLENGTRRVHYTSPEGLYLGYVDILSDLQTVDLINLQVQHKFALVPLHKRPAPVVLHDNMIYFPKNNYFVRREGGKLIPKQKRFSI